MFTSAALGSLLGILLNVCADRLPVNADFRVRGTRRFVRWAGMIVLSAGLGLVLGRREGGFQHTLVWADCWLLMLIAVVDLEHSLIPNALVAAGLVMTTLATVLSRSPALMYLAGAVVAGGLFLFLALLRPGGMGFGDVKLAVLIGAMTGYPLVLQALALGIVFGGMAAVAFLLTGVRKARQYIPYAPYLVAGSITTLLVGQNLATLYANLSGFRGQLWR